MRTFLTINDDCFVWLHNGKGLMYDSAKCNLYEFDSDDDISSLCDMLKDINNLYSIDISMNKSDISSLCKEWINRLVEFQMGKLLTVEEGHPKPISLPPLLNILKDVNKLRYADERTIGEDIMTYLLGLYIFIGGKCYHHDIYKQIPAPANGIGIMSMRDVDKILRQMDNPYLNNIFIIGNNIPDCSEAERVYKHCRDKLSFIMDGAYILSEEFSPEKLLDSKISRVRIICSVADDIYRVKQIFKRWGIECDIIIYASSEEDIQTIDKITKGLSADDYEVRPLFSGNNHDFFRRYVYISRDDIIHTRLSKREIFAHQAVNTNFFGKIFIMPDMKVYANINNPAIGTVQDSICELLYREVDKGNSWRMIRNNEPCSGCLYQYLCPSPSDYELVIGKPNLCSIYP